MKKTETKVQPAVHPAAKSEKKPYVAPKVTTHGDAAKLTKSYTASCQPECHSHLPTIPGGHNAPKFKGCK